MASKEPIAITGIGCRYPGGVTDAASFWRLMVAGVDAITEIPPDRWNIDKFYDPRPGTPGKTVSKWGGFVEHIEEFDAGFFRISAREAPCVDPQQRLLLLTAWEALEDAGLTTDAIQGTKAGVFVGISANDYCTMQASPAKPGGVDVWSATGGLVSIAANRISFCFDLRGPSIAVDTACSSSLIGLHLACESLHRGECPVALAGGVNALLLPTPFINFSTANMLSPDGRCKAFDASANGYVRAEGAGVVVLKPLSAALADGDPVYAVIRGTAANQDGRNQGMTIPNIASQAELVREACKQAGVEPRRIQYVEAHGTGTAVGDPIEAGALGSVLGEGRPSSEPCLIGSVKTNIGHLEAGAGIAGVIKTALTLHHGEIPPSLHCNEPNPRIDFDGLKLRVVRAMTRYRDGEAALAGVNSFGFGGANAHAILASAPPATAPISPEPPARPAELLLLSARCEESLRALAGRHSEYLKTGNAPPLADVCLTAAVHRTHHPHRAAILGEDRSAMARRLAEFAGGDHADACWEAAAPAEAQAPVFVFCGQGSQRAGMASELSESEPVFRETLARCAEVYRRVAGWELLEELRRGEETTNLHITEFAQPSIFAVQMGLVALLESWGIRPAAVTGHSVGEVAAACTAGSLDLETAARVVLERARSMDSPPCEGRMLSAGVSARDVVEFLDGIEDKVCIGAINSPKTVVLSGDRGPLEQMETHLKDAGIATRWLPVKYSFHSHHVDPSRERLMKSLGDIRPQAPRIPIISTVHGGGGTIDDFDAGYWWANVRHPVFFSGAIRKLGRAGHRIFVEVGPQAVLARPVMESLGAEKIRDGRVLATLRKDGRDRVALLETAGRLHIHGCHVDWRPVFAHGRRMRLPAYPWNSAPHWREDATWRAARLDPPGHPLLGERLPGNAPVWQRELAPGTADYLADHRVRGQAVLPAAAYIEMALAASRELHGSDKPCRVGDLDFRKPLVVSSGAEATMLRTTVRGTDWEILGSNDGGKSWAVHAAGIFETSDEIPASPIDTAALRAAMTPGANPADIYARMASTGLEFGPSFRGVKEVWLGANSAIAEVQPEVAPDKRYGVHPALLDSCLQVLSHTLPRESDTLYLPVAVRRATFHSAPPSAVWCRASLVHLGPRLLEGNIEILDDLGSVAVSIEGLVCRAVGRGSARRENTAFYKWEWESMADGHAAHADLPRPDQIREFMGKQSSGTPQDDDAVDALAALFSANDPTCDTGEAMRNFLAAHPRLWPEAALIAGARGEKAAELTWTPAREAIALAVDRNDIGCVPEALCAFLHNADRHGTLRALVIGADRAASAVRAIEADFQGTYAIVIADRQPEAAAAVAKQFDGATHTGWHPAQGPATPENFAITFDLVVVFDGQEIAVGELANLKPLLRPGGILLLDERHSPRAFDALVHCRRPAQPPETRWQDLARLGFEHARLLGKNDVFHLLAAQQPCEEAPALEVSSAPVAGSWLILADDAGCGDKLAGRLRGADCHVVTVRRGRDFAQVTDDEFRVRPESSDDFENLVRATRTAEKSAWAGIIHLWSLDASADGDWGATAYSIAPLVRALSAEQTAPRLFVATRGVHGVHDQGTRHPAQGPAWGFMRVVMNEFPRLRSKLVDLDPSQDADGVAAGIIGEIQRDDAEDEIALRDGKRYRHRLAPLPGPADQASDVAASVWELADPGEEKALARKPLCATAPGENEVEIEVVAAGLNFRDVMKSLGIYPANTDSDFILGDECSGRVVSTGPGVTGFRSGDEVIAIAPGCFASRVTAPARAVARKPARLDDASAATVPVAFLTAWHGLHTLARIRPGETVLIHAAAGGVGLAALQVARHAGADVIATAGSREKRAFLHSLGVRHVLDSRDTAFGSEVMELTGGRGVDIVLNSLAGDAIARGLACLAPHGRFVEIGKRDIYANSPLGLRAFRHSISFLAFDLAEVLRDQPDLCRSALEEICRLMEKGELSPLPHRIFPMGEAPRAFREMSQGRHIGKLVLVNPPTPDVPPARQTLFREDATYLVTGGTRGFGLAIAEWMASQGAKHLLLASRSGDADTEGREVIARMRVAGADVRVAKADVGSMDDVVRLLGEIPAEFPLAGIFHAAAAIEDATVATLEPETFNRVMDGKARGAWNLHRASADIPLDHFVLFSSVALTVGNPGQSAYCAANAFLASLADMRRGAGLPALCIDWGAIGSVGHAARQEGLAEMLHRSGFPPLGPAEATRALGTLLASEHACITAAKIDWARASEIMPAVQNSPRFSRVVTATVAEGPAAKDLRATLARMTPTERAKTVHAEISGLVARVVRTTPDKLSPEQPLQEIGFDSLMAIELVNLVERRFELTLPASAISSSVSASQIAEIVCSLAATGREDVPAQNGEAQAELPGESPSADTSEAPAGLTSKDADSERPLTWRYRAEAAALRAGMSAFRGTTRAQAHRRLRALLPAIRPFLSNDMRWARKNLKAVFGPALTGAQRERLARLALENHLLSYVEGLCNEGGKEHFENYDTMLAAHERGRGVILCGVHLGTWEPLLRWGPRFGLPLAGVYRRAHNPLADREFQKIRAAYGIRWIRSDRTPEMVSALAEGAILGMMTDLNTFVGAVFADFLGIPASSPAGPAALALHTGAPLVPAVALREENGNTKIVFGQPIEPLGGVTAENIATFTRRINEAFEPWILEYAEQYNWLHPRWRARPDGNTWTLDTPDTEIASARVAPYPALPARLQGFLGS